MKGMSGSRQQANCWGVWSSPEKGSHLLRVLWIRAKDDAGKAILCRPSAVKNMQDVKSSGNEQLNHPHHTCHDDEVMMAEVMEIGIFGMGVMPIAVISLAFFSVLPLMKPASFQSTKQIPQHMNCSTQCKRHRECHAEESRTSDLVGDACVGLP